MVRKRTVLVACGAGIATSTVVCDHLEELFTKHRLYVDIIQCKIAEVASMQDHADLIISTTIAPTQYKVPTLNGTAYISGLDMEQLDKEILELLQEK